MAFFRTWKRGCLVGSGIFFVFGLFAAGAGEDDLKALEATIESGDYAAAVALADRMLALASREAGPDSTRVAAILNLQVNALWRGGKIDGEVEALAERALEIRRQALGPSHPDTASSMNTLGNIRFMRGDFAGARETYAETLRVRRERLPPDHPDVATSLNNLALAQHYLRETREALRNFEAALAIREKVFGKNHIKLGSTIRNIGLIYETEGDLDRAQHYFQRALEIVESNRGPDHPDTALALTNLLHLHGGAGRYDLVKPLAVRTLGILESTVGNRHPDTINMRIELATALWHLGDRARAAPLFREALSDMEQVLEPDHPNLIPLMLNVAFVLGEEGKYRDAEAMFRKALALSRKIWGPGGFRTYQTLGFLADLYQREGRYAEAVTTAVEAESIRLGSFREIVGTLTEAEALRRERTDDRPLDVAAGAMLKTDTASAKAVATFWNQLIQSRAAILDEIGARGRMLRASGDPGTQRLFRDLEQAQHRLADLLLQGRIESGNIPYLEALDEALQRRTAAERALAERSAEMRKRLAARSVGLKEVRAALPRDTALVSFATYRYREHSPITDNQPTRTTTKYFALILPAGGGTPLAVPVGDGPELENRIRRWRNEAATPPPALPLLARKAETRYRQAGRALREMLWDPVARRIGPAKQVLIVPADQINLVSFATLPDDGTGYLVESGVNLHYLSAERDLAAADQDEAGRGLLAIGGVRYQDGEANRSAGGGSCRTLGDLWFTPLPGSRIEAEQIAELWRDAGSAPVLLTRGVATEEAFRQQAPGKEILHLATHGYFTSARCSDEAGGEQELTGTDRDLAVLVDSDLEVNPLHLTGLALAGANQRTGGGGNDGLLSAAEIAGLPLDGVRWAVLSACETGLGRIDAAEGVLGMRRAFRIAGASTLIMSLWPIEDQATRDWMTALYRARLEGLSSSAAVRRAAVDTLEMLRGRKRSTHPYTWGPFVAAGDYR